MARPPFIPASTSPKSSWNSASRLRTVAPDRRASEQDLRHHQWASAARRLRLAREEVGDRVKKLPTLVGRCLHLNQA